MKPREMVMLWVTGALVLFGATFVALKPQVDDYTLRQRQAATLRAEIQRAEETVAGKEKWEKSLGELQKTIRPLPADQPAANYLARLVSDLAARNGVNLTDRKPLEEKKSGGLHVVPISCRWDDARTEAFCRMLVDFLNNDVILDVVDLTIVSKGQDQIKGSFTVNCVYTK